MTLYSYRITIKKENRQYYAYSDDLPGVYGLGKTIADAKRSMRRGVRLYLEHIRRA
jgi:predicted RNase H-like HicB family nuclease